MDKSLYNAAITGTIEEILAQIRDISPDEVRRLRTSHCNNILHLASQFGHTKAVQEILSRYPSLISEVNLENDSVLHLAARGGHSDVVRALIDCAKKLDDHDIETGVRDKLHLAARGGHSGVVRVPIDCAKKLNDHDIETGVIDKRLGLLRCRNRNKDMALHEATRYNRIQVVRMLLEEDNQSTDEYRNKSGETLLYLAASRGFHDLVDVIVKACRYPAYHGPTGRTALHAAVICNSKDCVRRILEWRKYLITEKDDDFRLPIYYAAHLGFTNVVNELLSVDESIGYSRCDGRGNNALLVAASEGHISVMKQLISHHPTCFDDVNWKGRNVLHVAIKHEQKAVIEYLLEECPTMVDSLIIQKDIDGNTPLHLLATSNCFVPKLIQHPMADKGAFNNKGFTPLDLVIYDDDKSSTPDAKVIYDDDKSSTPDAKSKITEELKHVGAILHKRAGPPRRRVYKYFDEDWFDNIKKMTENHMIVAALIATIAFTAGFTMPGGYIQSGSQYEGLAVLSTKSIAFQAFIICDAIALLFSTSALFIYLVGAICDALKFRNDDLKANCLGLFAISGLLCNMLGLGAMIVAFVTGTYAVLQHAPALAIGTCVIVCCAFAIHSFVVFIMIKLFVDGNIYI